MNEFKTVVHAKCILAGEHAVLRGHPAIVVPVRAKTLELHYQPNTSLKADFNAPYGETLLVMLWGILNACARLLEKPENSLNGNFFITNNIPMGSGLGFSAALCTAITQWTIACGWLEQYHLFEFARKLEDHFHGKSSGLDIAGTLANTATHFNMSGQLHNLKMQWQPQLYLSSSQHACATAKCIEQVQTLWQQNKTQAELIDQQMANSVLQIEHALSVNENEGLPQLIAALNQAKHCFEQWNLITPELTQHMQILTANGAQAVKPTGSGSGGYILSLWAETPPADLPFEIFPLK